MGGGRADGRRDRIRRDLVFFVLFAAAALGAWWLFSRKLNATLAAAAGGEAPAGAAAFPAAAAFARGLFAAALAGLGFGAYLLTRPGARIERCCLGVLVPLGLLYLFLLTPLAAPDEQYHYETAYRLSNVFLFRWDRMDAGNPAHFDYSALKSHVSVSSGYDRIMREFFAPAAGGQERTLAIAHPMEYPLMYVPQALGIAAGRLLGFGMIRLFFLGRAVNFVFYAFCLVRALRETPRYRVLFWLVGTMPMAMLQAASYSYDAFLNGLSLWMTAGILKAAEEPGRMGGREYAALTALCVLQAPAKAYLPLLLLLPLIPKERFGGRKRQALMLGGIAAAALAATALFQLPRVLGAMRAGETGLNWEGQHNYTAAFALAHPLETAAIFLRTLRSSAQNWIWQCIGMWVGGTDFMLPLRYGKIYLALLALGAMSREEDPFRPGLKRRLLYAGTVLLTVFVVMASMFLIWTSDTRGEIMGVQGRYFIPVAVPALACLENRVLVLHRSPDRALALCAMAVHLAVIAGTLCQAMTV